MKSLFITILFSLSFVLLSNAQENIRKSSNNPIFWGYVNYENSSYKRLGYKDIPKGTICQQAIRIKAWNKDLLGKRICIEKIGLPPKKNIKKLWVWMSHTLPDSPEHADIQFQECSLDYYEDDNTYVATPEFEFKEPLFFTNEDVYVGYSYILSDTSDKYPIPYSKDGVKSPGNTHYISIKKGTWYDYSESEYTYAIIALMITESNDRDFLAGDVNLDNIINVADISRTVGYIINGNKKHMFINAADIDSNGNITVSDVERITDIILEKHINYNCFEEYDDELFLTDNKGILEFSISSAYKYRGFQMDIIVPNESTIEEISINKHIELSHNLSYEYLGNGRYRVVVFSKEGKFLSNNDLLKIVTTTTNKELFIENIIFVSDDLTEKIFKCITPNNINGIEDVEKNKKEYEVYNLFGIKSNIDCFKHNLYIINGKKFVK